MTAPELASYGVAAAGLSVLAVWRMRVRAGRDALGPRPEGRLPDLSLLLVAALAFWWGGDFLVAGFAAARKLTTADHLACVGLARLVVIAVLSRAVLQWPPAAISPARRAAAGLLGGLATYGIVGVIGLILTAGYTLASVKLPMQEAVKYAAQAKGVDLLVAFVFACVVAPVAEEMLYRGTLLPVLARGASMRAAITIQAVIFGCVHVLGRPYVEWPLAIPLAAVGWCAGWLAVRTSSVGAAVLLHTTFNAVNFGLLRWSGGAL